MYHPENRALRLDEKLYAYRPLAALRTTIGPGPPVTARGRGLCRVLHTIRSWVRLKLKT